MTYYAKKQRYILPNQTSDYQTVTVTAGRVYLLLFEVTDQPVNVDAVSIGVGTVSGTARVGIYGPIANSDTGEDCAGAALIVESAATALTNNTGNIISFTSTRLAPGRYYLAMQFSAADPIRRAIPATNVLGWMKQYDRSGGYGAFTTPCPTTANSLATWGAVRVTGA